MNVFETLEEISFFFVTSTLINFQLIFQLSIKCVSMHGRNWRIQTSFHMRMLSTKSFGIANMLLLTGGRFPKKSVFFRELLKLETWYQTRANFFKVPRYWQQIFPTQYFKLISVVDAIPIPWRLTIKQPQTNQQLIGDSLEICIELDETEIDLSKVTSKLLNNKFRTKKQTPPSAQNKMKNQYPQLVVDWKKIYS